MTDVIEGANAANVCQNVGSEREGMAVVDKLEDPELPIALQWLLQNLEGAAECGDGSITDVYDLEDEEYGDESLTDVYGLENEKYGDFFSDEESHGCSTQWRSQVRLKVFQAIGNCNTLEDVHLPYCNGRELEAALIPMQSNPVLSTLFIIGWDSDCAADVDRAFSILGKILQTTRTLEELYLHGRLTAISASHLASGLRASSEASLTHLSISGWLEASVVKHIADLISWAPRLEWLHMVWERSDDDGIDALSKALVQSTSLESLELIATAVTKEMASLLMKTFTGDCSNRSITALAIWDNQNPRTGQSVECFSEVLCSNQSLEILELYFNCKFTDIADWRRIGQSLCSNSTLKSFIFEYRWEECDENWLEGFRELLSSADVKNPIIELIFRQRSGNINFPSVDGSVWLFLANALSGRVNSLKTLDLDLRGAPSEQMAHVGRLFDALGNQKSSLQELKLDSCNGNYLPSKWKQLFNCLRFNTSLTSLSLNSCGGLDEEAFRDLMGLLLVNYTLQTIRGYGGSSWGRDGKDALIKEALKRNENTRSYFSALLEARLQFDGAKAGRLFLCGSPQAGKTQFRQTMARIIRGTTWVGDKLAKLLRTKGVEVELLTDDPNKQIAVWDLAGQSIFRTLQSILFPRTNHACVFIFVFSPYDENKGHLKPDLDSCLRTELEDWLRFIASHSQVTGHTLPQVLVVLTHMDKMKSREVQWAETVVEDLRREFKDILDLSPGNTLFQIDARRKREVEPVKKQIFKTFGELLEQKSPIVPRVCSQISSMLAKRAKYFQNCPLQHSQDFYKLCFRSVNDDAIKSFPPESDTGSRVFQAIASYLHDTGSVVVIPNSDYIVVNPNWLTNVFLGELIALGQNFQEQNISGQDHLVGKFLPNKTGFVSKSIFYELLAKFLRKHPELKTVDEEILEEILTNLDLCYKLDDRHVSARYYIPTIICEDEDVGRETLSWSSSQADDKVVGFRVQCQDTRRMSLTSAFFPRFQIHIRQKLKTEMDLTDKDVSCSRYHMRIRFDGHEFLLERSEMMKNHVDVMVKSSKNKSRKDIAKSVKHIIHELIAFCASPKGCPGVSLVVGILHTRCVQQLVPCQLRGDLQSILVVELMKNIQNHIQQRLEDMEQGGLEGQNEDNLLHYEHSWPAVPGYFPPMFELATDLLWESDVETILKEVQRKHGERLEKLLAVSEEMTVDLRQSSSNSMGAVESNTLTLAQIQSWRAGPMSIFSRSVTTPVDQSTGLVLSRLDRLEDTLDSRLHTMEITLEKIGREVGQIIDIQHKLRSTLSTFTTKVDKVIGYSKSWQQARTPRRPYFTKDDVNILHKVTAAMHFGTPVRLHLMCESVAGPHAVKDQPGLELCLDKQNMEWIRCISTISLKMMYYLVKAGLHVSLGLGQAAPELGNLDAAVPLSVASAVVDLMKPGDDIASTVRDESITLREAWYKLREHLASKLDNNYSILFKLYRVKYLHLESSCCAWLCEQCMARGIRSSSLQVL